MVQSTLVISNFKGLSLKYFEIFVHRRHIVFEKKIGKIEQPHLTNVCNFTPEVRDILKIMWKRGEIAPFLLFSTIFCYLLLDFHV